ncbi:zinc finger domain-containing protein (plasmid) [Coraliomargarita sp. W4R53]
MQGRRSNVSLRQAGNRTEAKMVGALVILIYLLVIVIVIAILIVVIRLAVKLALQDHVEYREKLAWARRHECPECGAPVGQGCIRDAKPGPDPVLRHAARIALDAQTTRVLPQ